MKRFGLFFVALACTASAFAQEITFKKSVHDFGTFPEEKGKVSCTFSFKNTGKEDLVLNKVRASCGCTTPEWTKTPIAPGDTGFVTATYNANGRPGAFNKTITVTSNAGDQRLTIKGEVTPKVKKVEDEYPIQFGDIRSKSQNVYMRNIEYPAKKTERLMIINNGKENAKVTFKNVPDFISVKANPETLKPGERGTIDITLDSKEANDWGAITPSFTIVSNGKAADQSVKVHTNIVENFSNLTPDQKANAPKIKIGNSANIGEIKKNDTKKIKLKVENEGKSNLIIRKAVCNDPSLIAAEAPSKPIKPGKEGYIVLTVNTKNYSASRINNRITIISNDPNNNLKVIQVSGDVK